MITFTSSGSFQKTENFLAAMSRNQIARVLETYGHEGVSALSSATPVDSGRTAASWDFVVETSRDSSSITWTNDDVEDGAHIAVLLQYGHGTGTGGYVRGRDYINPAIRPIFDQIADKVWKAVTSA